jgi:hypothetical protein
MNPVIEVAFTTVLCALALGMVIVVGMGTFVAVVFFTDAIRETGMFAKEGRR